MWPSPLSSSSTSSGILITHDFSPLWRLITLDQTYYCVNQLSFLWVFFVCFCKRHTRLHLQLHHLPIFSYFSQFFVFHSNVGISTTCRDSLIPLGRTLNFNLKYLVLTQSESLNLLLGDFNSFIVILLIDRFGCVFYLPSFLAVYPLPSLLLPHTLILSVLPFPLMF